MLLLQHGSCPQEQILQMSSALDVTETEDDDSDGPDPEEWSAAIKVGCHCKHREAYRGGGISSNN
jgi:hypothetical protein